MRTHSGPPKKKLFPCCAPPSTHRLPPPLTMEPYADDDDVESPAAAAFEDSSDELKPCEKKALADLRTMLEEAIADGKIWNPPQGHQKSKSRVANSSVHSDKQLASDDPSGVSLWSIPLLPSKMHEGTDVILVKFLRAREFRAAEAFDMIRRTLRWRKEFGIDGGREEEGKEKEKGKGKGEEAAEMLPHWKKAAYMDGRDREGNPVCYNLYTVFRDREVYRNTLGTEERRERFVRWRVGLMEEGIEQMTLRPGGAAAILHIIDFKDMLRPGMKEIRSVTKEIVGILQDNYPEFVAKNIFLNVSFRYYAYHALFSPFITPRTKSKFIFARPSKVTETLLKYMAPENIPIQYGGLKREDDKEFSAENGMASEMVIRAGATAFVEIPILEPGVTAIWDISVVGLEVNYKEEFIPDDEGSYKVLIHKENNLDGCIRNSFYISEPGKVVLTFDNKTYKKKRVLYRSKTKPTIIPSYQLPTQLPSPV